MKKNQVNALLSDQAKRRNTVLSFVGAIIIVSIITLSFFLIYNERNKKQYVKYDEKSKIDYKVYLNENDFFSDNYLGSGKQYIASLINYISANFNYKLSLKEKNIEYKYSYRIEADVLVKEKDTDNTLFNTNKLLVDQTEKSTNLNEFVIEEDVKIDYNYYNNLIKNFINVYGLDNTISTLNINMYIKVIGSCEDFEDDDVQESVMTLSIPLTTKTVAIELGDDLVNTENNVMQCKNIYHNNFIFIILGVIFGIIDVGLVIILVKFEINTRTAENIYERELKKILNNYSSYIQIIDNNFDFKDYQLLKVSTFTDMLEIRDTIKQPILMKENSDKTGAYFIIPSNTKILYVYRLKVSDIRKKINTKEKLDNVF